MIYHIADGRYVGETQFSAANKVVLYIRYVLDESGSVVGIGLWKSGDIAWTDFYFLKNLQGDVIQVYRESDNALVASYSYDSWGNVTASGSATFDGRAIKDLNPFRYRGYYYDNETWFYYLQSRYYDPAIGRFINADAFTTTGQGILGCNMYAYCLNDPVKGYDPRGMCYHNSSSDDCAKCRDNSLWDEIVDYWDRVTRVHQDLQALDTEVRKEQTALLQNGASFVADLFTTLIDEGSKSILFEAEVQHRNHMSVIKAWESIKDDPLTAIDIGAGVVGTGSGVVGLLATVGVVAVPVAGQVVAGVVSLACSIWGLIRLASSE